jgi:hypothetical protein
MTKALVLLIAQAVVFFLSLAFQDQDQPSRMESAFLVPLTSQPLVASASLLWHLH